MSQSGPWTATKGLKHPNDAPGKPPKDDDDYSRRALHEGSRIMF